MRNRGLVEVVAIWVGLLLGLTGSFFDHSGVMSAGVGLVAGGYLTLIEDHLFTIRRNSALQALVSIHGNIDKIAKECNNA